ncbi:MAG TPA: hypothetical protein VMN04_02700 [Thermoanaerobaculia bacterium]|nr:hypothetical protein [Thermoanaerobaculia bacterium]
MRGASTALVLALAFGAAASVRAQPTAVPTASGGGAVTPSDQTAVKPALPDESANRTVALGTGVPTPAPLPGTAAASASQAPAPAAAEEPGLSEPNTGTSPAAGSAHRKPGVSAARPVTVTKTPPYTVVAYEAGKSLTLRRPEGTAVTYPLSKKADVPKDLAPGRSVSIRTKIEHGKRVVTRVREAGDTPVLTNVN